MLVLSLTAGSEYPSGGGGGGGGGVVCSLFVASSPDYFVEGFPEWHFDAQWSPGLANSL